MKAAPEGVAMFVRPNWKDIKAYSESQNMTLCGGIAWEFLRRNPDYQKDVDLYRSEVGAFCVENLDAFLEERSLFLGRGRLILDRFSLEEDGEHFHMIGFHMDQLPERWAYWTELVKTKWGLVRPMLIDGDNWNGEDFTTPMFDSPETFEHINLLGCVPGPRILIPVDLSDPLEIVLRQTAFQIRRLRDDGIKSGTVKPVTSRVLSTAVYIEYLRILDGIAAGETIQKIGEVLSPGAVNTREEKQRDKRIRAAHKAALKMQDGGYRVLIY